MRAFLESHFGLTRAETTEAGRNTEIALRVFLPEFEGPYLPPEEAQLEDGGDLDQPRTLVMRAIRARRGQTAFRNALRQRYGDHCVVTGCSVLDVLEAAHIRPYRTEADNVPENGVLLRADVHTLFDLDLLGIDPTGLRVHLHPRCRLQYEPLQGEPVALKGHSLDESALAMRWNLFQARLEIS